MRRDEADVKRGDEEVETQENGRIGNGKEKGAGLLRLPGDKVIYAFT
jgi:hypothetical protein